MNVVFQEPFKVGDRVRIKQIIDIDSEDRTPVDPASSDELFGVDAPHVGDIGIIKGIHDDYTPFEVQLDRLKDNPAAENSWMAFEEIEHA